jgi:hypothetical protein
MCPELKVSSPKVSKIVLRPWIRASATKAHFTSGMVARR